MKSVKQKDRRKPSLLYCPEACEEDMVYSYSSLVQNFTSEIEKTRTIHKTAKMVRDSIIKYAGEKEESNSIIVSTTRDDIPTTLYSGLWLDRRKSYKQRLKIGQLTDLL